MTEKVIKVHQLDVYLYTYMVKLAFMLEEILKKSLIPYLIR